MNKKTATQEEISSFLIDFKKHATVEEKFQLAERKKDLYSIISMGLTYGQAKEMILELQYTNYVEGPNPHHDSSKGGFIWVFGEIVDSHEIYIKLWDIYPNDIAICLPFHKAEHKIQFVY